MENERQSKIDLIRSRTDIVDVISSYLPLTRKGKEYVGVCPFHDDHDPSMHVSPDKQIFKCFVCGAGGNVFTFLSKIEQISFMEAVSKAADLAGIPFTPRSPQNVIPASPYQPLYSALQTFCDYSCYMLKAAEGTQALDYLRQRKFTDELLETFEIGYAPAAGQVTSFLKAKNIPLQDLQASGLSYSGDYQSSGLHPVFHDRITIPIHDEHGHPVGITARKLPSDQSDSPKYINTTQTPVYEKGSLVFNYHRAREHARKSGYAYLVEGAMDVLGLEKAGIHEGIAMLGTACTPVQLNMLERLQAEIRVFYDADKAGRQAVWKFGQKALEAGLRFSVVSAGMSKDPDEIFITYGADTLKKAAETTISFAEFAMDFLQEQYNLHNYEDRKTFGRMMADLVRKTCDPKEYPLYLEKLKNLTRMDFSDVLMPARQRKKSGMQNHQKFGQTRETGLDPYMASADAGQTAVEDGRLQAEKSILAAMLLDPKYADRFRQEIGLFRDGTCQQLSLYIYEAYRSAGTLSGSNLISMIEEDEVRNLLSELLNTDTSLISDEDFWDHISKIKKSIITDRLNEIQNLLISCTDLSRKMELSKERLRLITERGKLR